MLVLLAAAALSQWGYDSLQGFGPSEWYKVSMECASDRQSPIDIKTTNVKQAKQGFSNLWIPAMPNGTYTMSHADSLITLDVASRGVIFTSSSVPYNMLMTQIVLHSGSEHSIDGELYQVEAQFVFEPSDIDYFEGAAKVRHDKTVISVMFDQTGTAAGFGIVKQLMEQSVAVSREGSSSTLSWNATYGADLRRNGGMGAYDRSWLDFSEETFYEYTGSMTTPPCYETVKWMVARDVRYIDKSLLTTLENVIDSIKGNNRPVQPLNGRQVTMKHYASSVSQVSGTEFIELSIVAAEFESGTPVPNGNELIASTENDNTVGLTIAIVILSLAIVGTIVATFITLSLKPATEEFLEMEMSDKGEEEEDGEEEEEDEEGDEEEGEDEDEEEDDV